MVQMLLYLSHKHYCLRGLCKQHRCGILCPKTLKRGQERVENRPRDGRMDSRCQTSILTICTVYRNKSPGPGESSDVFIGRAGRPILRVSMDCRDPGTTKRHSQAPAVMHIYVSRISNFLRVVEVKKKGGLQPYNRSTSSLNL